MCLRVGDAGLGPEGTHLSAANRGTALADARRVRTTGARTTGSPQGWSTVVRADKVKPLRRRDLRHNWASWAVQSGVTLHDRMLLGGRRSSLMVLRYAHFAPLRGHGSGVQPGLRPGCRTRFLSVEGSSGLLTLDDRETLSCRDYGGERGTTRRCAPRPFGAALRAFNPACGQVVEPAFCLSRVRQDF